MVRRRSDKKCSRYDPDGWYEVVVKEHPSDRVTHTYRFTSLAEAKKEAIALKTHFPNRTVIIYKRLGTIKCR